jgi:lipopolysaccharide transport system ATP-binding protein
MSDVAVRFENVSKMYRVFASRRDNLLDALGFERLVARRGRFQEFWALRDIDLELRRGERIGVIGRNGAGKSTLLRLVTRNVPPTQGRVEVHGDVQALMEVGGGLHPEFTGRENARASLSFLGLDRDELDDALEDIADFTELGRFLDQPFKTYSLGMQARLSLAIATTVRPEILIVDEILGAGDAYFFAKSTARMQELLGGGASVLLVSHALDQVRRFCERTIWLDRGRIVMEGETGEVTGAYEQFIRELDDRRLQADNEKARTRARDAFERDSYTDSISVRLDVPGGTRLEVSKLALVKDGDEEDRILVGDAQDAATLETAYLALDAGDWEDPTQHGGRYFRALGGDAAATGNALFHLWFYYPASVYALAVTYRSTGGTASASVFRNGAPVGSLELAPAAGWRTTAVKLDPPGAATAEAGAAGVHWPGIGDLVIDSVSLLGPDGETAVFEAWSSFRLALSFRARRSGRYDVIPIALVFRHDGVLATRHVAELETIELPEGGTATATLDLGSLRLGNGRYVVTVGLYRSLDPHELTAPEIYDVVDRSYEFQVVGNPPLHNELFHHPGAWTIEAPLPVAATAGRKRTTDAA